MELDIISVVLQLAAKYPAISSILMVVGGLRVLFKPIFSLLRAFVDYTPSIEDNAKLDKVEQSTAYKTIAYILDWFGSVKLPAQK